MKHIRAITLAAGAALLLGTGAAAAQTVSGSDPYQQGYAAGAATQDRNSFNTYDQAYQAGQQAEQDKQAANQQAYNNGYQAGMSQANKNDQDQAAQQDSQMAYNQGYQDRAAQDEDQADRAFDSGYNAGQNDEAKLP